MDGCNGLQEVNEKSAKLLQIQGQFSDLEDSRQTFCLCFNNPEQFAPKHINTWLTDLYIPAVAHC